MVVGQSGDSIWWLRLRIGEYSLGARYELAYTLEKSSNSARSNLERVEYGSWPQRTLYATNQKTTFLVAG